MGDPRRASQGVGLGLSGHGTLGRSLRVWDPRRVWIWGLTATESVLLSSDLYFGVSVGQAAPQLLKVGGRRP